jgi:arsenate reductase (thioredoxin)
MRPLLPMLALFTLAFCMQANAQGVAPSPVRPHRVVFVCEHGSVKSLVAMVYFNHRAQEQGLAYRAVARGIAPEPAVPSVVKDGLIADGFDVSAYRPRRFRASDVKQDSLVVSFDQDVAKSVGTSVPYSRWDGLPGVLADYPRGRDEIRRRVDALIGELAKRSPP